MGWGESGMRVEWGVSGGVESEWEGEGIGVCMCVSE